MPPDFTDAESRMIGQIMKASTALPDDFWGVAIVQELARLMIRVQSRLSDEEMTILVGVGAFIGRQAKFEMSAEIQTTMALAKAGFGRNDNAT